MQTLIKKIAAQAEINESKALLVLLAVYAHIKEQSSVYHDMADLVLGIKDRSRINQTYMITNTSKN